MNKLLNLPAVTALQRLAIWFVAGCLGLAIEVGVERVAPVVRAWIDDFAR